MNLKSIFRSRIKSQLISLAVLVVTGMRVENASAACASRTAATSPTFLDSRPTEPSSPDVDEIPHIPANLQNDDDNASVVGLWAVTFFVGHSKEVWDQGFEQWHSDGTELNNDNAVPPSLGNVCVGVYKQTGVRTFKLRHVTWNWDDQGKLAGTFLLVATVTVAGNGKTFTGMYTSDSFDVKGNVIPNLHAEGTISAKRISVD